MLSRLSYKAEQFEPSQEALANWFCAPGPSTQFLEIRSEMAPGWLAWPHLTRAPILGAKEALRVGQGGGAGRREREERREGRGGQGGGAGRRGGKGGRRGREGGAGRRDREGGEEGREEGQGGGPWQTTVNFNPPGFTSEA